MSKTLFKHDQTHRHIGMLAFTGCEILDVCGPLDIFCYTNVILQQLGKTSKAVYTFEILAEQAGPITTTFGVQLLANRAFNDAGDEFDTLIIAGGAFAP